MPSAAELSIEEPADIADRHSRDAALTLAFAQGAALDSVDRGLSG